MSHTQALAHFQTELSRLKQIIDGEVENFSQNLRENTLSEYGAYSAAAVEAYASIATRGGKRIRGALAIVAYQAFGGQNEAVAIKAALIMELIQAYLLVIDDVADRSTIRRGGPTAHRLIEANYNQQQWGDDGRHFGESIAVASGLLGIHAAMMELAQMTVAAEIKVKACEQLNTNLMTTIQGQFNDLYLSVVPIPNLGLAHSILEWKTAYYTFVNPLQFGAILAGADESTLITLRDFSLPAGRAFQLGDDRLGLMSEANASGKSPLDDIREGKRTVLMMETLSRVGPEDRSFLLSSLGNAELDEEVLPRIRQLVRESGALAASDQLLTDSLDQARQKLNQLEPKITKEGLLFLNGLLDFLATRQA